MVSFYNTGHWLAVEKVNILIHNYLSQAVTMNHKDSSRSKSQRQAKKRTEKTLVQV